MRNRNIRLATIACAGLAASGQPNLVLAEPPPFSFGTGPGEILIADFEQPNYGEWTVEGEAFGTGPATADNTKKGLPQWHEGKGLGSISLTAEDGSLTVESPVAFEMRSIWK